MRRRCAHRLAVDGDLAGSLFLKARDHPQKGRLAGTRGAENGQEAALLQFETCIIHCQHTATKVHRDVACTHRDFVGGFCGCILCGGSVCHRWPCNLL